MIFLRQQRAIDAMQKDILRISDDNHELKASFTDALKQNAETNKKIEHSISEIAQSLQLSSERHKQQLESLQRAHSRVDVIEGRQSQLELKCVYFENKLIELEKIQGASNNRLDVVSLQSNENGKKIMAGIAVISAIAFIPKVLPIFSALSTAA